MQTISQYSATSSILVSLTSWSRIWRHTCIRFWIHIRSRSPLPLDRFLSCQPTILIMQKNPFIDCISEQRCPHKRRRNGSRFSRMFLECYSYWSNVSMYFMTYFCAILSPSLCLKWFDGSKLTADGLSIASYAPEHSVRQIGLAGAATAEVVSLVFWIYEFC